MLIRQNSHRHAHLRSVAVSKNGIMSFSVRQIVRYPSVFFMIVRDAPPCCHPLFQWCKGTKMNAQSCPQQQLPFNCCRSCAYANNCRCRNMQIFAIDVLDKSKLLIHRYMIIRNNWSACVSGVDSNIRKRLCICRYVTLLQVICLNFVNCYGFSGLFLPLADICHLHYLIIKQYIRNS